MSVSEAKYLQKRLIELHVPENCILLDEFASNTGENIDFSYQLMMTQHIPVDRVIVVQKPYMLRRTYATLLKRRPIKETKFIMTSVCCSFEEYVLKYDEPERLINRMT